MQLLFQVVMQLDGAPVEDGVGGLEGLGLLYLWWCCDESGNVKLLTTILLMLMGDVLPAPS